MSGDKNTLQVSDVQGRPSFILFETQSGVIWHIKPINIPTYRAIQLKSEEMFPYPDPLTYQKPEENGFDENQLTPATNNPEYVQLCEEVDRERRTWVDQTIFDYTAKMPKYPTREALIDGFKNELLALREIAVLPDDDYEAILFHLVLSWNVVGRTPEGAIFVRASEYAKIIQLAVQTVTLTAEEVSAGIKFFRA